MRSARSPHPQMPTSAAVFIAHIPDPAWKNKPSWYMVAKADKIINPDFKWMYASLRVDE